MKKEKYQYRFDVEPVAKARPRVLKSGHSYTPKKTKEFERVIKFMAMSQRKKSYLTGALEITICFYLTTPKTVRRAIPTVRPDLDNYIKAVTDALNGIVWKDDSQIVSINAIKCYSKNGGYIELTVKEIG